MSQTQPESQVFVETNLEQQYQLLPCEYEVDCDENHDNTLYRLWKGWNLLGFFYQSSDGKWVAQPSLCKCEECFDTALLAQEAIILRSGILA